MYNTVPDLEASEEQPLVAAPPRKYGKASLAVVAALAFGAGALAPSAAARVGLTRFDEEVYTNAADYNTAGKLSTDNNKWYIGEDAATPVPAGSPDQEPAIVNYIPGAVQSSQSTDCNKAGGETVTTNPDCSDAIIQDAQETGGTGGETARK